MLPAHDPRSCPTCADAAERVVIVRLDRMDAEVEHAGGARERVAADLIDAPAVGDTILIHQGVAIARVAEATAP